MPEPDMELKAKCVRPETRQEVDHMILEYLVHSAIKSLLYDFQNRKMLEKRPTRKTELALQLVDSFLIMFRSAHPSFLANDETIFFLQLLRFTTLFTTRWILRRDLPTPQQRHILRTKNASRAKSFRSRHSVAAGLDLSSFENTTSISSNCFRRNYLHTLLHTYGDASPEPVPLGSLSPDEAPNSIHLTLLDTLPSFLALSASPTLMQDATTTALWMRLAARYMAQAALEQYLVFGTGESEKVLEAFSWGFDLGEIDNDEAEGMDLDGTGSGEDELAIANLFWNGSEGDFEDADGGEVAEWAGIRREHLEALVPPEGVSLVDHLQKIESEELSMVEFESIVVEFLSRIFENLPKPGLVRAEEGDLDEVLANREIIQSIMVSVKSQNLA